MSKLTKNLKKESVATQHTFDVAQLRKRLKLSQREFSILYHINIETLRKWEQRKRVPGSISRAYLKCIQNDSELIKHLINK